MLAKRFQFGVAAGILAAFLCGGALAEPGISADKIIIARWRER